MEISVCIPTYNQCGYLEQTVRSVLAQTLLPKEIIISDDCSTDDTPTVLERLQIESILIKVIKQPHNLGIAKNTDACLRYATCKYVARLDSDDLLLPKYLEKLSLTLDMHPKAGYAHTNIQEIDQFGNTLNKRILFRKEGFQNDIEALQSMLSGYRVAANIIMFRKEALENVNYIRGKNSAEDYYLASSIAAFGYGNCFVDEILACYRVWTDVSNSRKKRKLNEIIGLRAVFEEVLQPAYEKKEWNLAPIKNARKNFAITHSNCLSWNIYAPQEKRELANELNKLDSSLKTQFYIAVYISAFGKILAQIIDIKASLKHLFKEIYLNMVSRKIN